MKSRTSINRKKYVISWYNGPWFESIILMYVLRTLRLCHETRSEEPSNFLFWQKIDPLWWFIFTAKVLPENQLAFPPVSIFTFLSTQQSILHCRRDAGFNLSDLVRSREDRDVLSLETQRCFPISYGATYLSQSYHLETFPTSDGSVDSSKVEDIARTIAPMDDPKTQASNEGDLRFGFDRPYPLWKTRNGSHRLQSEKVGPPFLSSSSLLQRNHQRLLARRTSAWRCPYGYWNRNPFESSLCQITFLRKDRNHPSRQGFLRSRNHRISGIQESSFCNCGQGYRSGQERNHNLILSGPYFWAGECGIYVSTHEMEQAISVCGGQASDSRRPYGTTHPFLDGPIQLPSRCDQYETHPSQHLEILQRPGRRRTDYQRAQRRLSLRENPDEIFRSQRGLLPYPSVLLQSHQLVQTVMFTQGLPEYDAQKLTNSSSLDTRRTRKVQRKHKNPKTAGKLLIQRCIRTCREGN